MKKLIAIIPFLISGCASIEEMAQPYKYRWIPPPNVPEVVIMYHDSPKRVSTVCETLGASVGPNSVILACAIVIKNMCVVHLPKNAPESYLTHELLHCSGWKHEIIGQ